MEKPEDEPNDPVFIFYCYHSSTTCTLIAVFKKTLGFCVFFDPIQKACH